MSFQDRWMGILPNGGAAGPRTQARMARLLESRRDLGYVEDGAILVCLPVLTGLYDLYVAASNETILAGACEDFLPGLVDLLGADATVNLKTELVAPFAPFGFSPIEQIHYYILDSLGGTEIVPQIRLASFEDVDTILEIDARSFPLPYRRGRDELLMHVSEASIVRVVDLGGLIAGFSILQPLGSCYHLGAIGVAAEHRGEGWGGKLLDDAIREAHFRGAESLGLTTQTRNVQARSLYEKRGFVGGPRADFWARAGQGLEIERF